MAGPGLTGCWVTALHCSPVGAGQVGLRDLAHPAPQGSQALVRLRLGPYWSRVVQAAPEMVILGGCLREGWPRPWGPWPGLGLGHSS
jgi:hypothetical protein